MTQAHLVLADGTTYTADDSESRNSVLDGVTLTGQAVTTFVGGRQIVLE